MTHKKQSNFLTNLVLRVCFVFMITISVARIVKEKINPILENYPNKKQISIDLTALKETFKKEKVLRLKQISVHNLSRDCYEAS